MSTGVNSGIKCPECWQERGLDYIGISTGLNGEITGYECWKCKKQFNLDFTKASGYLELANIIELENNN